MSSQLTSLVTVFDGQNYGNWSKAMHAFLMVQGLWSYTDGTTTEPFLPVDPTPIPPLPSAPAPSQKDADAHKAATCHGSAGTLLRSVDRSVQRGR
jgi:hypothetical protein